MVSKLLCLKTSSWVSQPVSIVGFQVVLIIDP